METTEQLLISKIVQDKTLAPITEAGITPEYFLDLASRKVFQAVLRYNADHGSVPSVRRMRSHYPNFRLVEVTEPFSDLIEEVRNKHHLHQIEDALARSVEIFDDRDATELGKVLDSISSLLHSTLSDLAKSTGKMKNTDLAANKEERWEEYRVLKERGEELLGIPSGFARLDKALQGFQKGQLIVFAGPPKAGKSTLMALAALEAHRLHNVPLLIGFEMSNREQWMRIDAITSGVNHSRLRSGTLTEEEWKNLRRELNTWDQKRSFFLCNDTMSTTTLTGIAAQVEEYKPDILIVDGVYMMQDENGEKPGSPQALTNITRGFKRMAQNLSIPIIITTQVLEWKMDKKAGITANSVGYSSSFQQDADALIGVENTQDPVVKKIKIVVARSSPPKEILVKWDWDTGEFIEVDDDYFGDGEEFAGATF